MKKSLLLTLALGLASASQLMAVDVYITGSTAFRANVFEACKKMFSGPIIISYGDTAHGGNSPATTDNGNTAWAMSGTATNTLSNFAGSPLVIHSLFTGSVSGINSVEAATPLLFVKGGTAGLVTTAGDYVTNSATIAFSDSASAASPAYDVNNFSGFAEEQVAVQPFVICRSLATAGVVTNINNVTWEQLRSIIPKGRLPYSAWSNKTTDTNTFVYLLNRTSDSGTRVTCIEEISYPYDQAIKTYCFDNQSSVKGFYEATNSLWASAGTNGYGVIGATAGNNSANTLWGSGYIAGSDLRTALKYTDAANQSIGYLSFGDAAKAGLNTGGTQWGTILSFNGTWITAAGASINNTTTTTNDFSPVCLGNYPIWTYEVVVYPTGEPASGGISAANLGDGSTAGTFLGVLDHQTTGGGATLPGSLENEIESSKTISPAYATAIRLSDMKASRASVGGTIQVTPYPY